MVARGTMSKGLPRTVGRNALWFGSGGLLLLAALGEWKYGDPSTKDVLGWIGTVASTFAGAAIAFAFNAIRIRSDREEKEFLAGNLALMTLAEWWDRLLQYERDFVRPVQTKLDAWFSMRAGPLINVNLEIDKGALAFLLSEHPTTWRRIILEETRFNLLSEVIAKRTKMINEIVWPKMEAAGIGHKQSLAIAEIEKILGPTTAEDLKGSTAFIIDSCEKDIQSMEACISDVRAALVEIFPGRTFVPRPTRVTALT